ncbi:GntR family transcriptional regulator [Companilactobacillus ginsenosidimutans]|uniref:GntR family transcriptional regulator n=1 Tax=Companilactobacillus ginsenosidimutans TaxID=1007676 RepID=UPI00065F7521|nr:GntR family transcriptional regulator [Companilactobacillus ginsenosidimutans]
MPIPTSKPFEKQTAKDRAYNQIKEWIIQGELNPGEKLAEVELAAAISVSRAPIREALLKLNQDGFVIMASGKVTRVSPINNEDISTLFEPMAVIEGLAANQAASKIDEDGLRKIATLEKKYRAAINDSKIQTILKADRAFHQEILKIADNEYETQFSEMLYAHINRYEVYLINKLGNSTSQPKNISSQHDPLLKALVEHNATRASAAMTKDWLTTMRLFNTYQEQEKED